MSDSFGQIWRNGRLHFPNVPALLAQSWGQEVYQEICDRGGWSWLRSESEILCDNASSGTVNITRKNASVSGGTFPYASTDAGRQFRVGTNQPVYTIITASASGYTLDRIYGGATALATPAQVGDFYVTMPINFQRWIGIVDPANNWQLRYDVTEDELNTWDAQRSSTGTPRVMASRRLSTYAATTGQPQFELWPYQLANKNYVAYWMRRPEVLTDDTVFLGPLAAHGRILVTGMIAKCAAWPGLEGKRNPYFSLPLAQAKRKEFEENLAILDRVDQELYMTDLETVSWLNRLPYAPLDARYMQSHDISMGMSNFGASF